jgi:mRNA-binding protein PUF3
MPNETQNTQSNLTNTLLSRGLQLPGPWSNDATGGFAKSRDVVTPRGSSGRGTLLQADGREADGFGLTDAFNTLPGTGLGTAAAPSVDMASWGAGYWNATDPKQTRAVSGSTSPRTRSDASAHDSNPFPKFFQGPSTMSQGGPVGSRPATTAALEPSNGTFKYPSGFSDFADEGDGDQFMTQEYDRGFSGFSAAAQRQQAQEQLSLMNAVGSGPRKSVSSRPETDSFNDFTYGAPAAPSMHSQRPSLAGSSFSAQHNMGFDQNAGRQNHSQMVEAFGMMGMGNTSNGAANNLQNPLSYDNGSQNFQFNPGSQSWENGQGYANGHGKDAYANGSGFEKRGSIVGVGRNSPAGSTYRAGGGLNSPRSFTGTPQPNGDGWSRPTSRDPSLAAELARRGLEQFVQQPPTPFFANGFYSPNYPQFQSPYAAYGDPRHPAHLGGYGIPVPPYLGPGAVPTRPARDQDPGRAFRSAILHEFKNSPKSRRWELQVRRHSWLATGMPSLNDGRLTHD